MSEALAPLVRKGLLDRHVSTENRRVILISLSAEGQALLRRCEAAVDALEADFLAAIYPSEHAALRNMLRRLLAKASDAA